MVFIWSFPFNLFLRLFYLDLDVELEVSTLSPVENVGTVVFTCQETTTDSGAQYSWYFKGILIAGESAKTYTLTGDTMTRDQSGDYACNVTTAKPLEKQSTSKTVTFLCKCQTCLF